MFFYHQIRFAASHCLSDLIFMRAEEKERVKQTAARKFAGRGTALQSIVSKLRIQQRERARNYCSGRSAFAGNALVT